MQPFRVIVDTGSPYLVVPLLEDCNSQRPKQSIFGCATPGQFGASQFPSTSEQYGAIPGRMQWLRGDVIFGDPPNVEDDDSYRNAGRRWPLLTRAARRAGASVVFGGADPFIMSQSGGALLGLIRLTNPDASVSTIPVGDLRPTVLGQLGWTSFRLDAPNLELTLRRTPLLPPPGPHSDALPLVDPRSLGDSVEHVGCWAESNELVINGVGRRTRRPLLVVFDSGLTGCVLSQSLIEEMPDLAALVPRIAPTSLGEATARTGATALSVAVRTEGGRRVVFGSSRARSSLFYAQAVSLNWFQDPRHGPHVVALGQCVLGSGVLTVDGPQRRATWVETQA